MIASHDAVTDRYLVERTLGVLATPPDAPADSFVLHAPLELMARAQLLPMVGPRARDVARERIGDIAAEWSQRGPHVPVPSGEPVASLATAVAAGDVGDADRAVVQLTSRLTVDAVVAQVGDALLGHLGGAGHLAIFLDEISRLDRVPGSALRASRALVRDLARHPDWAIRWIDDLEPGAGRSSRRLADVLVAPPSAGDPGSDFIQPTMDLVDRTGLAAELLADPVRSTSPSQARQELLRVAAMSMLQDDPGHAPYGWSHCLTMSQAALAVAPRMSDPRRAVAIGATYVLGFRATQSSGPIDLSWRPQRPGAPRPVLDCDHDEALAQAWHAEDPGPIEHELATYAATHHDAHLVKYTLACLRAAREDPESAPLCRAAAARLALWWRDADAATNDDAR
jgi:hypothetical protein